MATFDPKETDSCGSRIPLSSGDQIIVHPARSLILFRLHLKLGHLDLYLVYKRECVRTEGCQEQMWYDCPYSCHFFKPLIFLFWGIKMLHKKCKQYVCLYNFMFSHLQVWSGKIYIIVGIHHICHCLLKQVAAIWCHAMYFLEHRRLCSWSLLTICNENILSYL